jgi:hypothetical protein
VAKLIDYREAATTNPSVDAKKMEQFLAYRASMEKAGLCVKPSYLLSPPLSPVRNKPSQTHLAGKLGVRVF